VLLITWQSWVDMPYYPGQIVKEWQVIIDEVPQLDTRYDPIMVPYNTNILHEYVEVDEIINDKIAFVKAKNVQKVKIG